MNSKPKSPPRSILFVWMMVIIINTLAVSVIFAAIMAYYRSTDVMEATDSKLLMAAEMSREILGQNYHDQIDDSSSVSEEQFSHIVERNDDLCRRLGLQYLWSVLHLEDDRLVFTSATHSDVNDVTSPSASFFETHRDPQAFAPAMGSQMKPAFSSFHNEWGTGRHVLVPRKDAQGRTYMFGASIQLAEYDALVHQSLLTALAIWFVVMCITFPVAFIFSRRIISPITELTAAADRMASGDPGTPLPSSGTQELQSLSSSFDRMRYELKQHTEELCRSEEQLALAMSVANDGIWDWYMKDSKIIFDDRYYTMAGYEPQEFKSCFEEWELHVHPDDLAHCHKAIEQYLVGTIPQYDVEFRFKRKDDSWMWIRSLGKVVEWDDGQKPVRFLGIHSDITERRQVEDTLHESKERYRTLINTMLNGFALHEIICDETDKPYDYRFLEVNPAFEEMTGLMATDIVGKTVLQILPRTESYWIDTCGKVALTGIPARIENYSQEIGKYFEVLVYCPRHGQFATVFTDITERRHAEEAFRGSEERFRKYFELGLVGMAITSLEKGWLEFNDTLCNLFGYSRQEFSQQTWIGLTHPDDMEADTTQFNRVLNGEIDGYSLEKRFIHCNGSIIYADISANAIRKDDGSVDYFVALVQDITERKKAENELQKYQEHLEELVEKRTIDLRKEITEREQGEEKIRRQNKFLNNVIESLDHPFYVINADDYSIVLANSHARALGSADANTCYAMTHKQTSFCQSTEHSCPLQELKKTKKAVVIEHIHHDQNGNQREVEIHGFPILNETGELVQMIEYTLDITKRKLAEKALQEKTYALSERVKELNCLYGLSQLLETTNSSLSSILQGVVDIIPPSWQDPDITCARLVCAGQEYKTENFQVTSWQQAADVHVYSQLFGCLEVGIIEAKTVSSDNKAFLYEEQLLLNALAERLGQIIEHKQAEEKLRQRESYLSALNHIKEILLASESEDIFHQVVDIIGLAALASRAYIFITHTDENSKVLMSQKAEYCAEGITPEINNPELQNFKIQLYERLYVTLTQGDIISGIIEDFPPDEKQLFEPQGIKAILLIPIMAEKELIGFIGFDNCISATTWGSVEQNFLGSIAHDLGLFIAANRSQRQLHSEYLRFQTAMDAMDAIVYVADMKTYELLFSNKSFNELFGNAIGEKCFRVVQKGQTTPCDFCTNDRLLDANGEPKGPYVWEFQNTITQHWYQLRDQAIRWPNGRLVRLEIAIDITERKQVEEDLRESKERLRLLSDNLPAGYVYQVLIDVNNQTRRFTYVSEGVEKIHEIPASDVLRDVSQLYGQISEEDACLVIKQENEAIENMRAFKSEVQFKLPSGKIKWLLLNSSPRRLSNNENIFDGVAIDITDRRQTEQDLQQSERNFRTFFDTVDDFLFILDEQGNIKLSNETVSKRLGYSTEELTGQPVLFVHPKDRHQEAAHIVAQMIQGEDIHCPVPLQTKSGELIPVETRVTSGIWNGKQALFGVSKDVSALALSEEKFVKAFHKNPAIVGLSELESGKFIEVNQTFCDKLGFTLQETIGERASELIQMNTNFREEAITELKETGILNNAEAIIYTKDGMPIDVLLSAEVIELQGKQYNFTTAIDITERKQAEEEIKRQSGLISSLLDSIPDIIFYKDMDGVYLGCNPPFAELIGRPKEEIINKTDYELFDKEIADLFRKNDKLMLERRETRNNDEWVTYPDGKKVLIDTLKTPYWGPNGEILGILGISRDITVRKQAEEEIKRQSGLISSLLDSIPDIIFYKDTDGVYLGCNPPFAELLGRPKEEIVNKTDYDLFDKETADFFRKHDKLMLERRETRHNDEWNTYPDGKKILLDTLKTPYWGPNGEMLGILGISRDITVRKQAEKALQQAKKEAETANQAKTEFLANMSHEIRTPMNAVIGMTQMLMRTDLNDKQKDYVNTVHSSSHLLLGIINDILDFSKIEANKLELDLHNFQIDDLLAQMKSLFGTAAGDQQIELFFHVAADLPHTLVGDALRLGQVLTNLLSNAIKFTQKGFVELSVTQVNTSEAQIQEKVSIRFEVQDTGIGLSEEQIGSLFNAFSQADTSTTRKYGGTGLGLVISSRLIEHMGGTLEVESTLGKGSTFFFELKLPVGTPEVKKADWSTLELHTVLVIDDHPTARHILRDILESVQVVVTEAESGAAALEAIKAAEHAGEPFDCILLDWKMPGEYDGPSMIKKLDEMQEAGEVDIRHTSMFIISAYKQDDLPTDCPKFDAFLSKPVTASDLFNAISEAKGTAISVKTNDIDIPVLTDYTVLLVEDNRINQDVALNMLEDTGIEVVIANNGQEALEILKKQEFDLILMDLQMPVMDGFEATRRIRQDHYKSPIIALSAAVMDDDRRKSYEAGVNAHLAKPIDCNELYTIMRHYLHSSGKVVQSKTDDSASASALPESLKGFDLQKGLERVNYNADFYHRMLFRFLKQLNETFVDIVERLEGENTEDTYRKIHTLKGLTATVGAMHLSEAVATVYQALEDGTEITTDMRKELRRAIAEVKAGLADLPPLPDITLEVEPEQGAAAIQETLVALRRNEVINQELLNTVISYLKDTVGANAADEFGNLVNKFEYDVAVTLLVELTTKIEGKL
ncbi:PAS domain S-box protein [Candidatus Venteria ishoeyi]|uniref:Sensory/regulatory protein RpfC n=1 Tax=Candidatus Venteria ishoeyi TaxID=1899563 RepID=A0A1H6FEG3_9GAMM|nr:PAS domain S-box protein [Candidatus Venteria ishoeyi]SEH08452.1 Signal transduction histidine-protein kinase BarA [Candidatus Venteria ishoeyi]